MSIEIVERFGWQPEMRMQWERRCGEVAQEIWERAGDGPLQNTSLSDGWKSTSEKRDGVDVLHMDMTVTFGSEDDEDPTAEGHVAMEFHSDAGRMLRNEDGPKIPERDLQGPTLPVSAYGSCNGALIPLLEIADQLAPIENPVWEVYSGLIRYADSTLNDYGLKWVLDEMRAVLRHPVGAEPRLGADPKESLLFAFRMLQDEETRKALDLDKAYAAVDKATSEWGEDFRAKIDAMKAEMAEEDGQPKP
jgi:hypothetical protein